MDMDSYEEKQKKTPRYKLCKKILKEYFGYDAFKPNQYMVIDRILDCRDCLAIFPTGYGKSILFQIPPLISNELGIVISPLIALMQDQQSSMEKIGIRSCCYNSSISYAKKNEMIQKLINGDYQLLYITPESLLNSYELLDKVYSNQGICMICIDEAHCISSYGNDFRPSYREIKKIRELFPNVPVLAVTATATDRVVEDIKTVMEMKNTDIIRASFDRPNLRINCLIQNKNTEQTIESIYNLVNRDEPTIIYCLTKNDTEKIAEYISKSGIECMAYHGGLTTKTRKNVQEDFMNGVINCISATIAFGMGINKQNIRKVIHYGCPQNIESYYQEIGRAGRDGLPSECWLYFKERDFIVQKRFIDEITNQEYKNIRLNLLHIIKQYVTIKTCFRKYILQYFGETFQSDNCMMCSNCLATKKNDSNIKPVLINQIIQTVVELGNTYGVNTLSLVLKGSESKKITPNMKKTTHYGGMKNINKYVVGDTINELVSDGYLESYDIGNMVHVLRATKKGYEQLIK